MNKCVSMLKMTLNWMDKLEKKNELFYQKNYFLKFLFRKNIWIMIVFENKVVKSLH